MHLDKVLRSKKSLSCEASGNPAPTYTWLQHTEEGALVRGHTNQLVVERLQYRDQGTRAGTSAAPPT